MRIKPQGSFWAVVMAPFFDRIGLPGRLLRNAKEVGIYTYGATSPAV
jgi:hypothetical protein